MILRYYLVIITKIDVSQQIVSSFFLELPGNLCIANQVKMAERSVFVDKAGGGLDWGLPDITRIEPQVQAEDGGRNEGSVESAMNVFSVEEEVLRLEERRQANAIPAAGSCNRRCMYYSFT